MKKNKNETVLDTARININRTQMRDDNAIRIVEHLIKHNYTVNEFLRLNDSLMDYPEYTIKAERSYIVFPESPRVKMNDLLEIFEKALDKLTKTGKVQIEIDQAVGAIDISICKKSNEGELL